MHSTRSAVLLACLSLAACSDSPREPDAAGADAAIADATPSPDVTPPAPDAAPDADPPDAHPPDADPPDAEFGHCQPFSCLNGGICTERPNGFDCSCPSGTQGPICELFSCRIKPPQTVAFDELAPQVTTSFFRGELLLRGGARGLRIGPDGTIGNPGGSADDLVDGSDEEIFIDFGRAVRDVSIEIEAIDSDGDGEVGEYLVEGFRPGLASMGSRREPGTGTREISHLFTDDLVRIVLRPGPDAFRLRRVSYRPLHSFAQGALFSRRSDFPVAVLITGGIRVSGSALVHVSGLGIGVVGGSSDAKLDGDESIVLVPEAGNFSHIQLFKDGDPDSDDDHDGLPNEVRVEAFDPLGHSFGPPRSISLAGGFAPTDLDLANATIGRLVIHAEDRVGLIAASYVNCFPN